MSSFSKRYYAPPSRKEDIRPRMPPILGEYSSPPSRMKGTHRRPRTPPILEEHYSPPSRITPQQSQEAYSPRSKVEMTHQQPRTPAFAVENSLPSREVTNRRPRTPPILEGHYSPPSRITPQQSRTPPFLEEAYSPSSRVEFIRQRPRSPAFSEEHSLSSRVAVTHRVPRTPSISEEDHFSPRATYEMPMISRSTEAPSPSSFTHQLSRMPSFSETSYPSLEASPIEPPPFSEIYYSPPSTAIHLRSSSDAYSSDHPVVVCPPSPTHYSQPLIRPFEATMIQGTNVHIGHANLNMTNQQVNEPNKLDALRLLRSNSSLAALVDASENSDPPRCIEGTRRNVIRELKNWIRHDSRQGPPSSIFWLYGGVGAGKSALAQTFAENYKANGDLAASFFFFRSDANRNDGNRLIPTLAYQLVHSFQGFTPFVEERIRQNPDLFKKNRQIQMLELLVEPLKGLWRGETGSAQSKTARQSRPRLVVIDGLDECGDPDIQCDLLQIIANTIPHLRHTLRFLITSRSESHIARTFKHDLRNVARYNLSDDSDADEDIQIFLEGEFAKIRRTHPLRRHLPSKWPPRKSISTIVDRSSGHFIYASTVIRFIQSPKHRPDDRLDVIILGLKHPDSKDRPYARLDRLYTLIFREIRDPVQLGNIHCAFGIIHLRSLKSGLFAWPQWISDHHTIESLLELRPGDLVLLFDPLLSLVTLEKDNIRILHKSLLDFLLDPSRSEDLQLDLGFAHGTAANWILKHATLLDNWNSEEFRDFAYHCQLTRLNGTLRDLLRSLVSDIKVTFTRPVSKLHEPSEPPCLLQSMLYFLQIISRQDFDSTGHCYRLYVRGKHKCLKSVVPWTQRLKCIIPLMRPEVIRKSAYFKRSLRSSFGMLPRYPKAKSKGIQLRDSNGFGRSPIPAIDRSVIRSIEREHEMFASYVKAHQRYPDIIFSFLEPSGKYIHSCHVAIRAASTVCMTSVMLLTYSVHGVRLSCSEFEDLMWRGDSCGEKLNRLVEEHLRRTEQEFDNSCTVAKVYSAWIGPP